MQALLGALGGWVPGENFRPTGPMGLRTLGQHKGVEGMTSGTSRAPEPRQQAHTAGGESTAHRPSPHTRYLQLSLLGAHPPGPAALGSCSPNPEVPVTQGTCPGLQSLLRQRSA